MRERLTEILASTPVTLEPTQYSPVNVLETIKNILEPQNLAVAGFFGALILASGFIYTRIVAGFHRNQARYWREEHLREAYLREEYLPYHH